MKLLKFDAYLKGIIFIAAGAAIAFFPNLLSGLFYVAGAAIIIYNIIALILSMLAGISDPSSKIVIPRSVGGILLGIAVAAFPKLLAFGLPVIIGLFFCITGLDRLLAAAEQKKRGGSWWLPAVSGAFSAILGIAFIFNPFSVSRTFTKIMGIIFIIGGVVMLAAAFRNKNESSSSVIDIDSFTVRDDDNKRIH